MGVCISTPYTTNLVLSNGTMSGFNHPITAAELMLEYPDSFVVEFRPNSSKNLPPLSPDHVLHPKNVYIMISMARAKVYRVSVEAARSILSEARSNGGKEKVTNAEKAELRMGAPFGEEMELLCRQYSSNGWKPSLGTIEERDLDQERIPHWLFSKQPV